MQAILPIQSQKGTLHTPLTRNFGKQCTYHYYNQLSDLPNHLYDNNCQKTLRDLSTVGHIHTSTALQRAAEQKHSCSFHGLGLGWPLLLAIINFSPVYIFILYPLWGTMWTERGHSPWAPSRRWAETYSYLKGCVLLVSPHIATKIKQAITNLY